jgi:hypothetical protein
MFSRQPIDPLRVRRIRGSFSWIDHRILSDGYLQAMSASEILLYFFLILVGDRNGVSFYSYERICHLLKMTSQEFSRAREGLIRKGLILYYQARYQVLALPEKQPLSAGDSQKCRGGHQQTAKSIAEILQISSNRKINPE